jgi:hypothetical protein
MGDIYEKAGQVLIYPGPLPKGLRDLSFWKRNPYVNPQFPEKIII